MNIKVLLASLACALVSFSAQSATVEIVPANQVKNVGDNVVVDIVGSGFTTPTVGGGFSLSFDSSVLGLQLTDVLLYGQPAAPRTVPGPWDSSFPRSESLVAGVLADFSFNQFSGLSGNFPIAQLTFTALSVGTSTLQLNPSLFFPFADGSGNPLQVGFGAGSVQVVPEPATWGMLAAGLALVGFFSMRRQRSA
jgi:hypothetical protein